MCKGWKFTTNDVLRTCQGCVTTVFTWSYKVWIEKGLLTLEVTGTKCQNTERSLNRFNYVTHIILGFRDIIRFDRKLIWQTLSFFVCNQKPGDIGRKLLFLICSFYLITADNKFLWKFKCMKIIVVYFMKVWFFIVRWNKSLHH